MRQPPSRKRAALLALFAFDIAIWSAIWTGSNAETGSEPTTTTVAEAGASSIHCERGSSGQAVCSEPEVTP